MFVIVMPGHQKRLPTPLGVLLGLVGSTAIPARAGTIVNIDSGGPISAAVNSTTKYYFTVSGVGQIADVDIRFSGYSTWISDISGSTNVAPIHAVRSLQRHQRDEPERQSSGHVPGRRIHKREYREKRLYDAALRRSGIRRRLDVQAQLRFIEQVRRTERRRHLDARCLQPVRFSGLRLPGGSNAALGRHRHRHAVDFHSGPRTFHAVAHRHRPVYRLRLVLPAAQTDGE